MEKLPLTIRQNEILEYLATFTRDAGYPPTVREIADHLKISVRTVETYRARLMKKLACESNVELTRYAIREGIVLV